MKIDPNDVEFEAFSGSGPGGQNRNKVMCCIRATHAPTGLRAVATKERSQTKNKQAALADLQKKLDELIKSKKDLLVKERYRSKAKAGFGTDLVRTCRMVGATQGVTDHNTGLSASLDVVNKGELDYFIEARLRNDSTNSFIIPGDGSANSG
jgi:peptide chain release factor 2